MYKTTKQDFELFKKECQYWIDKFRLDEWDIRFCYRKLKNNRAEINYNCIREGGINISFSTELNKKIGKNEIKKLAKHEVIHILVGELDYLANCRYVNENELYQVCEKIVNKLMTLL